jgi:hypothetical protein
MRLFRSEEEAPTDGATDPIQQLNELAKRWYGDRLDPDWRPRNKAESRAILHDVGLNGDFWELA